MARDFNGVGERYRYPSPYDFTDGPFAIAWWMRLDTVGDDKFILYMETGGSYDTYLRIDTTTGNKIFMQRGRSSFGVFKFTANFLVSGSWHHYVWTSLDSNDADDLHFYCDGSEVGYLSEFDGIGSDNNHNDYFWLGGNPGGSDTINGQMGEVAIYSRIPSAEEIAALANRYSPLFFMRDLRFCAPLIRDPDNKITGHAPTVYGSPDVYVHPPMRFPSSGAVVPAKLPTPVGDPFIPAIFHGMNF